MFIVLFHQVAIIWEILNSGMLNYNVIILNCVIKQIIK